MRNLNKPVWQNWLSSQLEGGCGDCGGACLMSCVTCRCPPSVRRESLCQWVCSPPVPRSFSQTSPVPAPQKTCFPRRPRGHPREAALSPQAAPRPASQTHCQDWQPPTRWVSTSSGGPAAPPSLHGILSSYLRTSGEAALWDTWVFLCVSWYMPLWPGFVCVCAEACGIHCQPRAESLQSCAPVSMCVGIDVAKSKVCPPGWVRFPVQIFVEIEEHLSSSSWVAKAFNVLSLNTWFEA